MTNKTPKTALLDAALAASVPVGPGHAVPPLGCRPSKPSLQRTLQAAADLPCQHRRSTSAGKART